MSSELRPHRPPPPPQPGEVIMDPSRMPPPPGKERVWVIRAEGDPTTYYYECNVDDPAAVVLEFEQYRRLRVATINGQPRQQVLRNRL